MRLRISVAVILAFLANTALPANVQWSKSYSMKVENHSKMIADAFNKFRYDMTVEWDQKDPYFKDYAQKQFENSLADLRAQGVSAEEILAYTESNILDEQVKKDFRNLLTTMKKQGVSEDRASELAMNFMEKSYARGANYSGGASRTYKKILIVVGVIIVGVVTYLIIKHCKDKHDDNGTTTGDNGTTSSTTGDNGTTTSTTGDNGTTTGDNGTTTGDNGTTTGDNGTTTGDEGTTTGDEGTTTGDEGTTTGDEGTTGYEGTTGCEGTTGYEGTTGDEGDNGDNGNSNGNSGNVNGNNGWGNGDQDAPGGSCEHNNAENGDCIP